MIFLIFFLLFTFQEKNPALLYLKSQIALEEENYQEAENFLKEAIQINPSSPFLNLELAKVLVYQGKFPEAKKILEGFSPPENLKEDYYSLEFYIELMSGEIDKAVESYGKIKKETLTKENTLLIAQAIQANILKYLSEENPENSIKLLKIYLNLFPQDAVLKEALLNLLLETENLKEAEEFIKNLGYSEENYPLFLNYLTFLSKKDECKKILEMEDKINYMEREELLQIFAYCNFMEGNSEKSLKLLSKVLSLNPKNELVLRLIVEMKIIEGDYKGAQAILDIFPKENEQQVNFIREKEYLMYQLKGELEKAEEILIKLLNKYESKEKIKVLNKLYNFYKSTGNCSKTIEYAFQILEEEGEDSFNYYRIAEAYIISKDVDKALFFLRIYNDEEEIRNLIDSLWLLLDYGYLKEAQMFFEELNNFKEELPEKNQVIGFYFFKRGEIEKMEEILRKDKENSHSLNLLGYLLIEKDKKIDEAINLIQKALEYDPYNGAFLDSLGWGYYKKGDMEKAYHYLKQANFLQPYSGTILSHLGDVCLKKGDLEEALLRYHQALYFQEPGMDDVAKKIQEVLKIIGKKKKNH